jgi:hypothetical protein
MEPTRTLLIGPAGWVRFEQTAVLLRVQTRDGRLRVCEVYAGSDEGLTARGLRETPLGWVEAVVNRPDVREVIEAGMGKPPPELRPGASFESVKFENPGRSRVGRLRRPIPKSKPYGDDFYGEVATLYYALAEGGRRPAAEIAEVYSVPASTVHGWIREARRRGFLPPARQGTRG